MIKWIKNFITTTGTGYYYEPEPGFINDVLNREILHNTFTKLISEDGPNNDITLICLKSPFVALIHNDSYIDCKYRRYIIYYRGEYYKIEDILTKLYCWPKQQFKMWLTKIPSTPIKNNTGKELIFISEVRDDAYHLMHQGHNMYVLNTRSSKILFGHDKSNTETIFIDAENYEIIPYNIYPCSDNLIREGTYEGGSFIIDGDEYKIDLQLQSIVGRPYELYKFDDIYAVILDYIRVSQLNRVNKRTKPAR